MYNLFDGAYKRSPIQNLGGSSIETDRQTLIKKAQTERKKREETRKKEVSALKIQSFIRWVWHTENFVIVKILLNHGDLIDAGVTVSDSTSNSTRDWSSRSTTGHMDWRLLLILNFYWKDFWFSMTLAMARSWWVSIMKWIWGFKIDHFGAISGLPMSIYHQEHQQFVSINPST